jgi:vacuolar-type H+-ATPase subunit I/STV1
MPEEKPTVAIVLSLIGGILILLFGMIMGIITIINYGPGRGEIIIVLGLLGIIYGILVIIGASLICTGEIRKVRIGGVLVLLFSILSIFSPAFGGFIIGFILGFVGNILALVWKPIKIST